MAEAGGRLGETAGGPPDGCAAAFLDPGIALTVVACSATGLVFWVIRERRLAEQQRAIQALHRLSEEIISARSAAEIARQLAHTLPRVTRVSLACIYLYNRRSKCLELEPSGPEIPSHAIRADSDHDPAICFRQEMVRSLPDTNRSPYYSERTSPPAPVSVILAPMRAEGETLGVLELGYGDRVRQFGQHQEAAAQHLANQIAIALRFRERQSIREQLFRSEKLAAAGQLVSSVVTELLEPLESLATRAGDLRARLEDSPWREELLAMETEARRAAELIARLVTFSRAGQARARPVDVNALLRELIDLRRREWDLNGLQVEPVLSPEPLVILGAEAQLEQVLLTLLVHGEQAARQTARKRIRITSRLLAQRVLLEISYSCGAAGALCDDPLREGNRPETAGLGATVCRAILQSHGGEIRFRKVATGEACFEIALPPAPDSSPGRPDPASGSGRRRRQLTVLVLDRDDAVKRQLTALCGARGHRVVPLGDPRLAADLVQRLRFDLLFCATRLPDANWLELFPRLAPEVAAFVAISEPHDLPGLRSPDGEPVEHLVKPIQDAEFERLIARIEKEIETRPAASPSSRT